MAARDGKKTPEQQRIADLEEAKKTLNGYCDEWQKRATAAEIEAGRLRVLLDKKSITIRELEAAVADRQMQIARMDGYLDRVHDDDQERAGVDVIDRPPPLISSRRPQPRRYFGAMGSSGGSDANINKASAVDMAEPSAETLARHGYHSSGIGMGDLRTPRRFRFVE